MSTSQEPPDPVRIIRQELQRSREALKPPGDVHEARRALKRVRALLRLCRGTLPKKRERALRHEIRDVGRILSPTRDQEVAREVLEDAWKVALSPASFGGLVLEEDGPPAGRIDTRTAREARERLKAVRRDLKPYRDKVDLADAIAQLAGGYRRFLVAAEGARTAGTGTAFHTLRKRAKDLRYQMEWVTPLWPEVVEPWVEELHHLTDDLGRNQDVLVVRRAVRGLSRPRRRHLMARVLRELRREARCCRHRALARCARLRNATIPAD